MFLNTGELLKSYGHEVIYFCQQWDQNLTCKDSPFFPKGVDTKSQGLVDKLKGICNYFYNIEAAKKLEELLVKEKPDIAHIHLFWGGISPSIFKVLKRHNVPIVHTAHDYRIVCPGYAFKNSKNEICEKCEGNKFYHCIINRCSKGNLLTSTLMCLEMYNRNCFMNPIKNIDSFMFVSNFSYKKHLQYAPAFKNKHCVTMYNFQDAEVLSEADKTLDTFDSYYLFYGRLSYEKGIKTLISAFTDKKNLKLKIVGTGPLEKDLKKLCIEKNATNIEFLGYKTGKDLYGLIKKAKFVCVPSECYENNPMTIIESYTLRTPVVGAGLGGITEIIEDGSTGYKFKSGDVEDLKNAIDKTVSLDNEKYSKMKDCAEAFGKENFSKENYYARLMKLYKHTINNYNNK